MLPIKEIDTEIHEISKEIRRETYHEKSLGPSLRKEMLQKRLKVYRQAKAYASLVEKIERLPSKDKFQPAVEGCDIALIDFENKGFNECLDLIKSFIGET